MTVTGKRVNSFRLVYREQSPDDTTGLGCLNSASTCQPTHQKKLINLAATLILNPNITLIKTQILVKHYKLHTGRILHTV